MSIIMGDFNAKVGSEPEMEGCTGPYAMGVTNKSGSKLGKFCLSNNLKIANTYFNHTPEQKWTWRAPDGKTKNEIDHLLTNQISVISDNKILEGFLFSSDHRPVVSCFRTQIGGGWPRSPNKAAKTSLANLWIPMHKRVTACEALSARLGQIQWDQNLQNSIQYNYDLVESSIKEVMEEFVISNKNIKTDDKLSSETKSLISKRALIKGKITLSVREQVEITELNKTIRKMIKEDQRKFNEETAREIIESSWSTRKVKKVLSSGRRLLPKLLNLKGEVVSDRTQVAEIATKFYSSLYCDERGLGDRPIGREGRLTANTQPTQSTQIPHFTKREVFKVLKKLKTASASGPDEVSNDMLRMFKEVLAEPLAHLFNAILSSGLPPSQWFLSEIILIHKKGCCMDMNNYRPISLSSCILRTFMVLLKNKCYSKLDEYQKTEQAGFRKGFSTVDHIQAINQLLEKANEFNHNLALMFVDYNKAFDSLYHEKIWEALTNQGIPGNVIEILNQIYKNSTARVRLDRAGSEFKIERGVRQGDPFSPNLFNAVLEEIFGKLGWKNRGLKIKIRGPNLGEYKNLNHLRFADDVVLIAKNGMELGVMAEDLRRASEEYGLSINFSKTKVLTNISNLGEIKVGGNMIEKVQEYKYLGQLISFDNKTEKELKVRRGNAWKAFWAQKHLLKSNMKLKTKIRIFESTVIPVLLYGAQTWALTSKQMKKIQVTQNSMIRSILGIRLKDKVSIKTLFDKSKAKKVWAIAKSLKFKYAGHLIRGNKLKWNYILTTWVPHWGKRRKVRPRTRWSDELRKLAGSDWPTKAKDRNNWKGLVKTFAHSWAVEGAE